MRIASRTLPVLRGYSNFDPPSGTPATNTDALYWTWEGDAVTSWIIKWGTSAGVYTNDYPVADPDTRAVMFYDFLTGSGDYYISVFAVNGGVEGDNTDEVNINYTA